MHPGPKDSSRHTADRITAVGSVCVVLDQFPGWRGDSGSFGGVVGDLSRLFLGFVGDDTQDRAEELFLAIVMPFVDNPVDFAKTDFETFRMR